MTLGAQGLQLRANSWQQLLAGGIAFDTSAAALSGAPSAAGSIFTLYQNRQAALGGPGGSPLLIDTLHNLNDVLRNLDHATSGPQLRDALVNLNRVLTHLDHLASTTQPDLAQLLKSLRATSDAARRTMVALQNATGSGPANTNLPQLMSELSQAARSVRELADYLDRHPDALLRGRRAASPR
jgi:paraquat-inducible protein B